MTAAMLVLGIAVVALSDRGLRTELLQIADRVRAGKPIEPDHPAVWNVESTASRNRFTELPSPDPHGVITLTDPGPYTARSLATIGPLTITAAEGIRPKIVIDQASFVLSAPDVALNNVEITLATATPDAEITELLQIRSQRLHISGCRFTRSETSASLPDELSAISWKPIDRRDP